MTTLKDLKVPFKVRAGSSSGDFTYTSKSGVNIKTKAEGQVAVGTTLPVAQAGISIEFSEEGAFLFQAVGCSVDEIEDKVALGRAIISLIGKDIWDGDWGVVDTLVRAKSATIVVSNSHTAALELTAKAPLAVTNLANLDTGLSVNFQKGDMIRFIAAQGLAPLFKLSRAKRSLLERLFGLSRPLTFGKPAPAVVVPGPLAVGGAFRADLVPPVPRLNLLEAVMPEEEQVFDSGQDSRVHLSSLHPLPFDEGAFDKLIEAAKAATDRHESMAQLRQRIAGLGAGADEVARELFDVDD
jgi:hypothetical protein